jgi:hypothetical protein
MATGFSGSRQGEKIPVNDERPPEALTARQFVLSSRVSRLPYSTRPSSDPREHTAEAPDWHGPCPRLHRRQLGLSIRGDRIEVRQNTRDHLRLRDVDAERVLQSAPHTHRTGLGSGGVTESMVEPVRRRAPVPYCMGIALLPSARDPATQTIVLLQRPPAHECPGCGARTCGPLQSGSSAMTISGREGRHHGDS